MSASQAFLAGAQLRRAETQDAIAAEDRQRRIAREDAVDSARRFEALAIKPDGTFRNLSEMEQTAPGEFAKIVNSPGLRDVRNASGHETKITKIVPLSGPKRPGEKEQFAFEAQWLDENGNPKSQGPVTQGRTNSPSDSVAVFNTQDLYNQTIGELSAKVPNFTEHLQAARKQGAVLSAARDLAAPTPSPAPAPAAAPAPSPAPAPAGATTAPVTPPAPVPAEPIGTDRARTVLQQRRDLEAKQFTPPVPNTTASFRTENDAQYKKRVAASKEIFELSRGQQRDAIDAELEKLGPEAIVAASKIKKHLAKVVVPSTASEARATRDTLKSIQPKGKVNTAKLNKKQMDAAFQAFSLGMIDFKGLMRMKETGRLTKRELGAISDGMGGAWIWDKENGLPVNRLENKSYAAMKLAGSLSKASNDVFKAFKARAKLLTDENGKFSDETASQFANAVYATPYLKELGIDLSSATHDKFLYDAFKLKRAAEKDANSGVLHSLGKFTGLAADKEYNSLTPFIVQKMHSLDSKTIEAMYALAAKATGNDRGAADALVLEAAKISAEQAINIDVALQQVLNGD